jgi:hypothetical protein
MINDQVLNQPVELLIQGIDLQLALTIAVGIVIGTLATSALFVIKNFFELVINHILGLSKTIKFRNVDSGKKIKFRNVDSGKNIKFRNIE